MLRLFFEHLIKGLVWIVLSLGTFISIHLLLTTVFVALGAEWEKIYTSGFIICSLIVSVILIAYAATTADDFLKKKNKYQ